METPAHIYRVNEIFYSLQGEGLHVGTPAVFVRFSGCNLRCPFCDTDFAAFSEMTAEAIVARVQELSPSVHTLVVLTGGEPMLQVDEPLLAALHSTGKTLCLETNGTLPVPESVDFVTCSPKEGTKLALRKVNEVKVVFTGTYDPEVWREQIKAEHWLLQPLRFTGNWLIENIDSGEDDRNDNLDDTVRYILSHPFWRLSVQLHKIVGLR